jgi:predicted dehydrogenase
MLPNHTSTLCLSLDGLSIEELPLPALKQGYVRVQTIYSCVSPGTESSSVTNLKKPLLQRALSKPDQIHQVVQTFKDRGVRRTLSIVKQKLASFAPLGYSCVGKVIEVSDSSSFNIGDLVACGGVSFATHGTLNTVPESLCTLVTPNTDLRTASAVALGSIALHAFRRTESVLGCNILVVGLGPIGLLAAEIASAAGCNVVGFDICDQRVKLASTVLPNSSFFNSSSASFLLTKSEFESYFDSAIVSASSSSTSLLDDCTFFLGKKAKLVILGDVPIQCERSSIYNKEIDLLISTSYGPGRYDSDYEELNIKYPIEHARWTETENFKAFIKLVTEKKISSVLSSFREISQIDYINSLPQLNDSLFFLIKYPEFITSNSKPKNTSVSFGQQPVYQEQSQLLVDFIGISGYLKSMIIPYTSKFASKGFILYRNCYSSSSANSAFFAKYYNMSPFSDLATFFSVSQAPFRKLAIISSKHADHCAQICSALDHDYIVYCEKPLCVTRSELDIIASKFTDPGTSGTFILLGYNRRYSPHTQKAKNFIRSQSKGRISNTKINYIVNIRSLDKHPWLLQSTQGSRNIGETCHMYDFCNAFFDDIPLSVDAINLQSDHPTESFVVVLRYPDNNTAIITYALVHNISVPKEVIDIKSESSHVVITDFKKTTFSAGRKFQTFASRYVDKGQQNMWKIYISSILSCSPPPVPFQQLYSASSISFDVENILS